MYKSLYTYLVKFDVETSVNNTVGSLANLFLELETRPAFSLLFFELLLLLLRLGDLFLGKVGDFILPLATHCSLLFVLHPLILEQLVTGGLLWLLMCMKRCHSTGTAHSFLCYLID